MYVSPKYFELIARLMRQEGLNNSYVIGEDFASWLNWLKFKVGKDKIKKLVLEEVKMIKETKRGA